MSLRNLGLISMATVFSISGFAQSDLETEIKAETAVVTESKAPQITTQEVYVIQGQDQKQDQAQEAKVESETAQKVVTQPTTVVEAAPLVPSRAEQLRNARQQAEIQTEQKIVEKLEDSRLKDEERRAKKLFGDKLTEEEVEAKAAATETVEKEEPKTILVIEKAQEPKEVRKSDEELKNEIAQSVKEDLSKINEEEKAKNNNAGRMSFSGLVGSVGYDAINIGTNFAAGAAFGWVMDSGIELEAGLEYSNHTIDETPFNTQEMDQYNWSLAAKYSFLQTRVSPVLGAIASLTQRTYSTPPFATNDNFDSLALDAGLLIGVNIGLTDNVALGVDYRRFMNLTTRYENDQNNRPLYGGNYNPIEEQGYDVFNLGVKFLF